MVPDVRLGRLGQDSELIVEPNKEAKDQPTHCDINSELGPLLSAADISNCPLNLMEQGKKLLSHYPDSQLGVRVAKRAKDHQDVLSALLYLPGLPDLTMNFVVMMTNADRAILSSCRALKCQLWSPPEGICPPPDTSLLLHEDLIEAMSLQVGCRVVLREAKAEAIDVDEPLSIYALNEEAVSQYIEALQTTFTFLPLFFFTD